MVERVKLKYGRIDFLCIDYVQLVDGDKKALDNDIGTLLASGIIGPGTALYQVLGGIVSALTALGVKSLVPAAPATPSSSTASTVRA